MSSSSTPGVGSAHLRRRGHGGRRFAVSGVGRSWLAAVRIGSHEVPSPSSHAGAAGAGQPPAGAPVRWSGPLLVPAVVLLAFAARLVPMLAGGGLGGIGGYDDGVYYTAAASLVHGRLPYQDFLLLHPPGILLVLAPFAWLGSHISDAVGFAVARVAFMLIGALNAALVVAVLRRYGPTAAAAGGIFYALFYPAVYAERSTLLEPLGTLALLVALLLLGRATKATKATQAGQAMDATGDAGIGWRCYAAGAALGAGVAVKIWYVVAVLVLVAVVRGAARRRVLAGAAAAAAAICLPFFVAAPTSMFRYVITDQVGRPGGHVSVVKRVESIVGLDGVAAGKPGSSVLILAMLVLLAVFAACAALTLTVPAARIFVWLLAVNAVVLLASPSYFKHYPTLTAAPLALIVGVAVARVTPTLLRRTLGRPLLGGVALVAVVGFALPGLLHSQGTRFPGPPMRGAAARVHGCVTADDPTALVELNVLTSDLDRGCLLWPDVTGWTYDTADVRTHSGKEQSRPENTVWQRLVLGYLKSGSAVILARPDTGLSQATKASIDAGPVLAHAGGYALHGVPAGSR